MARGGCHTDLFKIPYGILYDNNDINSKLLFYCPLLRLSGDPVYCTGQAGLADKALAVCTKYVIDGGVEVCVRE